MLRRPFRQHFALIAILTLIGLSSFAARGADSFDPMSQVGPDPVLPEPQQYLFSPMRLAKVVLAISGSQGSADVSGGEGPRVRSLARNFERLALRV
jgi:hypothetical protein